MWINFSEWEKNVKIFVFHVNTHQWVTSAEEDFSNQVNRMTCSVDTSQPLSPATPVITQRAHEQSGHVWQEWRLCIGSATWTSALNQCPIYGAISSIARSQGVEMGVASLIITLMTH